MAKLVPENHPVLHTIAEEVTKDEIQNGFVTKLIKEMKGALKTVFRYPEGHWQAYPQFLQFVLWYP